MHRFPADRIMARSCNRKSVLAVERDGARIVGVDVKIESAWRDPFRFNDKRFPDTRAPAFRRDDQLIKITRLRIDGDKADHRLRSLGNHDFSRRHQFVTPTLAPPIEPRGEIERRIGRLPGPQPQRDRGVLVANLVGSQVQEKILNRAYNSSAVSGLRA
jgi:hypothetical protein